jgi:hypothetical protein
LSSSSFKDAPDESTFALLTLLSLTFTAVISRQFREMQRSRIEGLLASFPKLTSAGHQHTTVETEHVRYVYQPLDELFMVLITNRQVNGSAKLSIVMVNR